MFNKIHAFLKNIQTKRKCNKGLVPILLAVITTGIFMPTLAIVYDLAQMRLYKTDITNIAQMAVLSCVAHSGNEFDVYSCRNTIRNIISINLFNTVTTGGDDNQDARARAASRQGGDSTHPIPEAAFKKYFARPYSSDTLYTTMNNVQIDALENNKGFYVVMYASYKPTFLKFGEWGSRGIQIRRNPVAVSASYICQNGKCKELEQAYEQQKAIEDAAKKRLEEKEKNQQK